MVNESSADPMTHNRRTPIARMTSVGQSLALNRVDEMIYTHPEDVEVGRGGDVTCKGSDGD